LVILAGGRLGGIRGGGMRCGGCKLGDVGFGENWGNGRSGVGEFLPGAGI
jgi:hypothetical protein